MERDPAISEFFFTNFKSYRSATLPVATLTLLIGANASGKSNALEAIEYLSWLARGRRLDDIWQAVREDELSIRGTVTDLCYPETHQFELGCVLTGQRWRNLRVTIRASADGLRIVHERVIGDGPNDVLYSVVGVPSGLDHNLTVAYHKFAKGPQAQTHCTDLQAVFTQFQSPALFQAKHHKAQQEIPRATRNFQEALAQVLFLNPMPPRMRGYSFPADRRLKSHGDNLSAVLFHLCEELGKKEQVLDFVRALPEQDIKDIDFLKTPRTEVMVRLTESFGPHTLAREAPLLSDGTLRVLGIAAALLSVPEGTLVVIEELDNGIHPSRARMLLTGMDRVARQRGLRVLLTSHNPALASALPLHAVPNVVYCYRDMHSGESRLRRLEELPDYPGLMGQGPLGQLMAAGELERTVKDTRSDAERQQATAAWLDDFLKEAGSR